MSKLWLLQTSWWNSKSMAPSQEQILTYSNFKANLSRIWFNTVKFLTIKDFMIKEYNFCLTLPFTHSLTAQMILTLGCRKRSCLPAGNPWQSVCLSSGQRGTVPAAQTQGRCLWRRRWTAPVTWWQGRPSPTTCYLGVTVLIFFIFTY